MNSIEKLLASGQYDKALTLIAGKNDIESIINRSRIYEIKGLFLKGLRELDNLLDKELDADTQQKMLIIKSLLLQRSGQFEKANGLLDIIDLTQLSGENRELSSFARFYYDYIRGDIERENGNNIYARSFFEKALETAEIQNNPFQITLALRNIGSTHTTIGEVETGLEYYTRGLNLAKEQNDLYNLGLIYNSLGVTYWTRQDYEVSLEYYNHSLNIWQKIGNKLEIAKGLLNIGSNYREVGEIAKAKSLLQDALIEQYKLKRISDESFTLFELFQIAIYENNIEDCNSILSRLESLCQMGNNRYIETHWRLCLAVKLKQFGTAVQRSEAKGLFENVIYSEMVSFSLTIYALKMNSKILLDELKLSSKPELLDKLTEHLDKMETLSRKFHYYSYIVEALDLKSNVAIITGDLDKAQRLLIQAEEIARHHQFTKLLLQIRISRASLDTEVSKIMEVVKKNNSITQRLKDEYMQDIVETLGIQLNPSPQQTQLIEIPVMFFITTKEGNIRLLYEFDKFSKTHPGLIASFIAAINSFMGQAFEISSSIESIKHKEFTITMDGYNQFLFCYIYKGRSTNALKNLKTVVDTIIKDDEISEVLFNHSHMMVDINERVELIFLNFMN